jgi:uncharacterized cupredoxin-like copper-binding protein
MRLGKVLLIGASLMVLGACGGNPAGGGGQASGDQTVAVTLDEFHLKVDRTAIPAGNVTFDIDNKGTEKHEFVILRTDLAVSALPTDTATNKVQEEATGIVHVDEIDGVDAGQQKQLSVDLKPGTYLLVCNYPGHVHGGMVAQFTVS